MTRSPRTNVLTLGAGATLLAAFGTLAFIPAAYSADAASAPMAASAPVAAASATAPKGVSGANSRFLAKAAASGTYEVEIAKLGATRGANAAVKTFAQMLVDDHTAANKELETLASSKNVTLPTGIAKAKQTNIDRLSKLDGKAFDTAFIQQVGIKDHREAIALFDGASKAGGDPDVKKFAAKTLPTLRHHLSEAQDLPRKISGNVTAGHVVVTPKP
jgi:putative membrane protein